MKQVLIIAHNQISDIYINISIFPLLTDAILNCSMNQIASAEASRKKCVKKYFEKVEIRTGSWLIFYTTLSKFGITNALDWPLRLWYLPDACHQGRTCVKYWPGRTNAQTCYHACENVFGGR